MNYLSNEVLKELSNSITRVFNADGFEILFTNAELKYIPSKYNMGNKSLCLLLDNTKCQTSGTKVEYKCKCGANHKILLKKFLCKTKLNCVSCKETEEKKKWHSKVLSKRKDGIDIALHRKYCSVYNYNFEEEDEEFKKNFWKMNKNLTSQEFKSVLKYIYSIDGHPLEKSNTIFFLPHEPCFNQKRYTPMVAIDGEKIHFRNIKLKCPYCGTVFGISRGFKKRIECHNFDCQTCTFTNKVFKRIKYRDGLIYQSKLEKKFIDKCDSLGVEIKDGPKIEYVFEDKMRTYLTDFELPSKKMIIEIKDNHVWHTKQVENGRWQAKENAVNEYCKQIGYKFKLIFPKDFETFFDNLSIEEIV